VLTKGEEGLVEV